MLPIISRGRRFHEWLAFPRVARRLWCLASIAAVVGAAGLARAASTPSSASDAPRSEFLPPVVLEPLVIKGERLSISILARTKADRRYAEKFAADVIETVYATLEKSPGAGLVIIGEEGEPHPVFVLRQFVALAESNQLNPVVAARAAEVSEMMRNWERRLNLDEAAKQGLPTETFMNALPLPLEGVASKLYQLAWAENFDPNRVEQKLRSLTLAELNADQLSRFDWVFYLPPRDAFRAVMKAVVPAMLKKEKVGPLKRAAIRSAMVAFAPAIRKGVEGARKGMLFMTVFRARSSYSEDDIMELTRVYVRVLMPDFKFNESSTHERAIAAIEAQKIANVEYAKDPFVSPPRLAAFDPEAFAEFEGGYAEKPETTHRFVRSGEGFAWKYLDHEPRPFFPAGDRLFVSENGKMTTEFLVDETGAVTGVEERWHRRRKTLVRTPSASPSTAESEERKASGRAGAAVAEH